MSSSGPVPLRSRRGGSAARMEGLLRAAAASTGRRREELLEEAIVAGVPLARTLARRYQGRGVDREDLYQIAYEQLVKAARNYSPSEGSDFRSYAVPTIRGGIRHHFRDCAWAVKLPRRLQDVQARVNEVEPGLAADLAHWPTHGEIAEAIGVDVTDVREAEQARGCFRPSSLDAPLRRDRADLSLSQLLADPSDTYELVDQVESLLPVVNGLSARDRLILRRRFVDHRSQSEIGAEIGVSQMQVSRLLKNILGRLQLALSA